MLRDLFSLFPAYAGVIPLDFWHYADNYTFPRICGGDPKLDKQLSDAARFSPHMRG